MRAVLKIEEVEEVQSTIREIVVSLASGRMSKYKLVAKFCVVCEIIRRKGLMCELCELSDPSIDIQQCCMHVISFASKERSFI
ncbi:MAG: hypothetical protein OEY90_02960, partial [Candidatus Bathyarchaeota archaeon]|nr:hypothetical protein [Candidatus Bathyarchaeota archaeon]